MGNTKNKTAFHAAYTDFHCILIALMNKYNFQQYSNESISETQFNIVDYVIRHGKKTAGELAKAFHISTPAISRQTKLLLDNKLITQTRDADDRRMYFIAPTARGKKMVEDSVNVRRFMTEEIADILNDRELAQFTRLLGKVNAGLTKESS